MQELFAVAKWAAINAGADEMHDPMMEELMGRIDGLSRTLLFLVADAENAGLIEGREFTTRLRLFADELHHEDFGLLASKRMMESMADRLDEARSRRELRAQRD
jgi:hypothetical protein